MSFLIVPDVHENIEGLERLLSAAGSHALTVFLGDWFDSHTRTERSTLRTLGWLLANWDNPAYFFLWGNHDLPYAFPNCSDLLCSGHNWTTRALVAQHSQIWDRFVLTGQICGVRISHAGFTPETGHGDVNRRCEMAMKALRERNVAEPLIQAGRGRGGRQDVGGCTWLDWDDEFRPINGVRQIVGHSRAAEPRWNGDSVCLDTDLRHYAVITTDGGISVYGVDGGKVTQPVPHSNNHICEGMYL